LDDLMGKLEKKKRKKIKLSKLSLCLDSNARPTYCETCFQS
jgi:hypothetical protein